MAMNNLGGESQINDPTINPDGSGNPAPSGPSSDQIAGWYQQYLHRTASPEEIQGWISGAYGGDPSQYENQIKNSGEAQAYAAKQGGGTTGGGGTAPSGGSLTDPAYAAKLVAYYANQPGANPSLKNDPNYWIGKLTSGAFQNDQGYAVSRFMQPEGAPEGSGGPGGPSGVNPNLASWLTKSPLLEPWTTPFNLTPFQSGPGFQQPTGGPNTDAQGNFVMPNNVTEQNDPGYQFRLQQGQQAVERSAAAKGTLLTGGTLKDLTDYQQGAASQEYGNVYQRALTDWQNNYNSALTNYQTKYNAGLSDWTTNYNAANQQYQQAYNIFSNNQANQYNRIANLAGLGQTAATSLGSQGLGYTGLSTSAINAGGNALAAGTIGQGNAYSNLVGNLGSIYGNYTNLGGLYGNNTNKPLNSSSYTGV